MRKKNANKAVSPAIATVMLIAITLIAGVAIGGYVFGLFGSQTSTAQVTSTLTTMTSGGPAGIPVGFSYHCVPQGATQTGQLAFSNNGVSGASILAISIIYAGQTYTNSTGDANFALVPCLTIPSGGPMTVYISG